MRSVRARREAYGLLHTCDAHAHAHVRAYGAATPGPLWDDDGIQDWYCRWWGVARWESIGHAHPLKPFTSSQSFTVWHCRLFPPPRGSHLPPCPRRAHGALTSVLVTAHAHTSRSYCCEILCADGQSRAMGPLLHPQGHMPQRAPMPRGPAAVRRLSARPTEQHGSSTSSTASTSARGEGAAAEAAEPGADPGRRRLVLAALAAAVAGGPLQVGGPARTVHDAACGCGDPGRICSCACVAHRERRLCLLRS